MDIPITNQIAIALNFAPLVFLLPWAIFKKRHKYGGHLYGTVANAFLFWSLMFSFIDIYLAKTMAWETLTSWPVIIYFWLPMILSPIYTINSNSRTGEHIGIVQFFAYFFIFIGAFFVFSKVGMLIFNEVINPIMNLAQKR